jgi:hypothetical protein
VDLSCDTVCLFNQGELDVRVMRNAGGKAGPPTLALVVAFVVGVALDAEY